MTMSHEIKMYIFFQMHVIMNDSYMHMFNFCVCGLVILN